MQIITLRDVLEDMEKGEPFDISFIKADTRRKLAGKSRTYTRCVLHSRDRANCIRRVQLPNGKVRAIHIRLITHYNNQRVIY